ncbi:sulfite exporter TauE/SafE family protein [Nocardia sp. NRRL S-836]|uniref:sulfite exporter TauE/SafE family protein n=1 Tax=Nocardia sp. NRRL S-836 TaxID=1519492 RepID=UPI0006C5B3D7|nr:sulfite exporter TauE/SafE family protein [Nocardia sp. NRRL S-836]KOV78556.1 sulfite exporter TauE/SafE family protein [Nocardia sp. NRRL S-836]
MGWGIVVAGVVVALGGLLQGLIGFGLALVAVPLIALLDPALLPVPVLMVAAAHASMALAREFGHVDWRGVGWAMLGRLPGTVVGVLVVDALDPKGFGLVVGGSVLACVLLSISTWRPVPRPGSLVTAGFASGSFGTATSVGGPMVALLYQNQAGPQVRATLAAFFVLGSGASIIALSGAGQVSAHQLWAGVALIPFLVAGFLLSGPLRKRVDAGGIRAPMLVVAGLSSVVLIVRSVLS